MRVAAWLALAALSVAVGVVASVTSVPAPGIAAALSCVALMCIALGAWSLANERDPLSPLFILSGVLLVLYVLRPIYILTSGRIGPARALDDRQVTIAIEGSMTHALWLVALGILGIALGYFVRRGAPAPELGGWRALRGRIRSAGVIRVSPDGALVSVLLAFLLAAVAYWSLIRQAGGFGPYINELSLRSGLFYGRGYLALVTIPLKVAALCLVAVMLVQHRRLSVSQKWFLGGLVLVVTIGDFLSGGRAALILGTLLPVTVLVHYLRRPLAARTLVFVLAGAVVLFVGSRVVTRDAVYEGRQQSRAALVQQALLHLPASTVGSHEAIPFDSLVTLVDASNAGAPLQLGRTYLPILSFLVPRAVWHGKPVGGANAWFTRTYYPDYYGPDRIETSVSMIGELYANFGAAGIVVGCFLFGFVASLLYRRLLATSSLRYVLLYALLLGYVFTLVRGDAYHSITGAYLTAGLALLMYPVMVRPLRSPIRDPAPPAYGLAAGGPATSLQKRQ